MDEPRRSRRLAALEREITTCERCPELREYCRDVAARKKRAFREWAYWGRPVPGFGDHEASILIVGLAPAAHGANRTGRMFTGDRSGDFLYAALHRAGLASQSESTHRDDGLVLRGAYITAPLRCAPPGNKPTPAQRSNCAAYLGEEIELLDPKVIVCLGAIGWDAVVTARRTSGAVIPRPKPKFRHGGELTLGTTTIIGCYHVSQQNTFTGRLTPEMMDDILARATALV